MGSKKNSNAVGRWWNRVLQQKLWGFTPFFPKNCVIVSYLLIGLAFTAVGVVLLIQSLNVQEQKLEYDIDQQSPKKLKFQVDKDWDKEIYIYYEIENFFQNHKRYVRSVDWSQLHSGDSSSSASSQCAPVRYATGPVNDTANNDFENKGVRNPCGLIAWSYFNDTYSISVAEGDSARDRKINIDETNIAWNVDKTKLYGDYKPVNFQVPEWKGGGEVDEYKGKEQQGGGQIQGNVSEDEHFMVWMRVDARPTIRKIWGRLECPDSGPCLSKGDTVTVQVENNYNTTGWDGKKYVVLSTVSFLGGRNHVLGISYIVVGCLFMAASMCIAILSTSSRTDKRARENRYVLGTEPQPALVANTARDGVSDVPVAESAQGRYAYQDYY